jgi:hypothetical protein
MALTRAKYKRIPDLYVAGTEVVLKDGSVVWLQVLNPLQADEARHDAQVARARLVMALKKHGGDEMSFVESALWQDGIDGARDRVVESKANGVLMRIVEEIRNDPDWTERLEILNRVDDGDEPREEIERTLLAQTQVEYIDEVQKRVKSEEEYLRERYKDAGEDELREEYVKLYLDRRGGEVAAAEFRIVELWYGARVCEGVQTEDGWNHDACDSHKLTLFETKAEIRQLPEDLTSLLSDGLNDLAMSLRDAKDLARPASSSDSSRRPSEPEESTPSTPTETPSSAPGTSPQPSPTPSPS